MAVTPRRRIPSRLAAVVLDDGELTLPAACDALGRTQKMMDPDHCRDEYDLAPAPDQSLAARLSPQQVNVRR